MTPSQKENYNWMPVFKTGSFTDKHGRKIDVTVPMLDHIANNYNAEVKKANFVIQHPGFDEVGFGHPSEVKRVGNYLFAKPEIVNPDLKKAVNTGKLPHRSITLDKDTLTLKNISFLPPEEAPAVEGLGEYQFSAGDADNNDVEIYSFNAGGKDWAFADLESNNFEFATYEVTKWPFKSIERILRNIKNYFIDELGQEKADTLIPEFEIEETGEPPRVFEKPNEFSKQQKIEEEEMDLKNFEFSRENVAKLKPEDMQSLLIQMHGDLTTAQTVLSTAAKKDLEFAAKEFTGSDELKKKVLPAIREDVEAIFIELKSGNKNFEFSKGDEKVTVNAVDSLKKVLMCLPEFNEEEIATRKNAGETDLEFSAANKDADDIAAFANAGKTK